MWQVRGPLTALRTLGSILVPRLRQKEGQEIDRDVAQGILTQVGICPGAYTRIAACASFFTKLYENPNCCSSACSMCAP